VTSSPRESSASGGWTGAARVEDPRQPRASTMSGAGQIAAVGVDRVARPPVDLRDLEARAALLEQQPAQLG
jgi:hypothetical protein